MAREDKDMAVVVGFVGRRKTDISVFYSSSQPGPSVAILAVCQV